MYIITTDRIIYYIIYSKAVKVNFLSSSFFSPILFFRKCLLSLFASNFAVMKLFLLGNKSIYTKLTYEIEFKTAVHS